MSPLPACQRPANLTSAPDHGAKQMAFPNREGFPSAGGVSPGLRFYRGNGVSELGLLLDESGSDNLRDACCICVRANKYAVYVGTHFTQRPSKEGTAEL